MVVVVWICQRITRKVSRMLFWTNCLPGKDKWLEMNSLDGESEKFSLLVVNIGGESRKVPLLVTYGNDATWDMQYRICNAAAICFKGSELTSRLWSLWVPRWTCQLFWPRRTSYATQRKLARQTWRPCHQGSNILLLDPWNVCSSEQKLKDTVRRAQEGNVLVQQDVGKQ